MHRCLCVCVYTHARAHIPNTCGVPTHQKQSPETLRVHMRNGVESRADWGGCLCHACQVLREAE